MRPTLLHFRSPKERTPDAYYPEITIDGDRLLKVSKRPRSSFGTSQRFRQYEENSKRLGFMLGPGSYKDDQKSVSKKSIPGSHVYKGDHKNIRIKDNCYYYVDQHLVYDSNFPRRKKNSYRTRSPEGVTKDEVSILKQTRPASVGNSFRGSWSRPTSTEPANSIELATGAKKNFKLEQKRLALKEKTTSFTKSPYLNQMENDKLALMIRKRLKLTTKRNKVK